MIGFAHRAFVELVHFFLDDAEPVLVGGGFGVVVVVVDHFKILILIVLSNGRFYFSTSRQINLPSSKRKVSL
jgi:hypothetical protein